MKTTQNNTENSLTNNASANLAWLNLPNLPLPLKALFTGYLLVVGVGLLMAGLQIMLTHGMADGKVGLSKNDIVYSYYGDRTHSLLESKLNGSMKANAPDQVRTDIILWVRKGAKKEDWDAHFKGVFAQHCVMCHSVVPNIPNFKNFEEVQKVAATGEGATIESLTRVSHIHLFGISFIFFFIGDVFKGDLVNLSQGTGRIITQHIALEIFHHLEPVMLQQHKRFYGVIADIIRYIR